MVKGFKSIFFCLPKTGKPNVLGNATWKPIFKTDNVKLEQFQTVSVLRKVIHKFDVVVDFDFHSIKLSACLIGLDRHDPVDPGKILVYVFEAEKIK